MKTIILLLSITVITLSLLNTTEYCFAIRAKYHIQPGYSYGTLPQTQIKEYNDAKCYRYFCEPHKMSGRGKFKCIPLSS
jgi:hypothetical protein